MDIVLEFLGCRADFICDGDDCFEEIGKFFWWEDDERDGAEDDEFLPADVEHGGIVGGGWEDCKGLRAGSGVDPKNGTRALTGTRRARSARGGAGG